MYKIGNTIIKINGINNTHISKKLELFTYYNDGYDFEYDVEYINEIENLLLDSYVKYKTISMMVVNKLGYDYICFQYDNYIYGVLKIVSEKKNVLYIHQSILNNDMLPNMIPGMLCLERVLIHKDSFVLHSSCIEYNKQTILFTAPSGGGKSTQADLWKKHKDVQIINGDKNIIGLSNSKWYSYGIPFSGSSEYCINKTYPIKAIVILDKGKVNDLHRVDLEGFSRLFSQVTVNP